MSDQAVIIKCKYTGFDLHALHELEDKLTRLSTMRARVNVMGMTYR